MVLRQVSVTQLYGFSSVLAPSQGTVASSLEPLTWRTSQVQRRCRQRGANKNWPPAVVPAIIPVMPDCGANVPQGFALHPASNKEPIHPTFQNERTTKTLLLRALRTGKSAPRCGLPSRGAACRSPPCKRSVLACQPPAPPAGAANGQNKSAPPKR